MFGQRRRETSIGARPANRARHRQANHENSISAPCTNGRWVVAGLVCPAAARVTQIDKVGRESSV